MTTTIPARLCLHCAGVYILDQAGPISYTILHRQHLHSSGVHVSRLDQPGRRVAEGTRKDQP